MTRKTSKPPSSPISEFVSAGSSVRGYIFIGVFVGVIVLGAAFLLLNNNQPTPAPAASSTGATSSAGVQTFPDLGRDHINLNQSHPAYNSNPPTSGWHYPVWADWGIYVDAVPDEYMVHNLEHGGIWISYRDSDDASLISQLQLLVSNDSDRMVMTYRPQDDTAIAVAAWGVLLELDKYDEAAIKEFTQNYRYHGPENVAGNAGG